MREGWTYKKLGEVATYVADGDWIESKDQSADGIRLIQTGNIGNGVFKLKADKPHYISKETFSKIGCNEIFEGDCLISRLPDPIGRACVIPNIGCRMITAVDCSIIRFDDNYLSQFFVYYSQSSKYRIGINNNTTGSTRKRISRKNLENILIPILPLSEQQSIVWELDKINELISLKKAQLSDLDSLAQSIFYDMFGDPIENEKGWEVKKMMDLCTNIVDCPHSTPKKSDSVTDYPCIRTSELKGGSISWDTMQYLEKEEYEIRIARLKPEAGDIVFGREGTIGDAVILPKGYNFSLGQRTMLLRANTEIISNVFLHRVILSEWMKQQIEYVNVSSTVAHVNIKDFKQFTVPLPPLSLLQEFAKRIELIEQQKAQISSTIKDLETLLASRMQYWFD